MSVHTPPAAPRPKIPPPLRRCSLAIPFLAVSSSIPLPSATSKPPDLGKGKRPPQDVAGQNSLLVTFVAHTALSSDFRPNPPTGAFLIDSVAHPVPPPPLPPALNQIVRYAQQLAHLELVSDLYRLDLRGTGS